jgi:surfactin synthase thioesterase subunit
MKLFCLPFAGGSSISYRGMYSYLDACIQPHFLEIPGHGSRAREPLQRDMTTLVDTCFETFCREHRDESYAVYGHSMGAVIGYLLTRKIIDHGFSPPEHLFFSGRQGPAVPDTTPGRHLLPGDEFFAMLEEFDGSPKEVLQNRELMEYFEPILRADFQACESFRYVELQPLPVPITVMYGEQEPYSSDEFLGWQRETIHELRMHSFPGGHFFIFAHWPRIGKMISATLRLCCLA